MLRNKDEASGGRTEIMRCFGDELYPVQLIGKWREASLSLVIASLVFALKPPVSIDA